jgi:hypothetical protein
MILTFDDDVNPASVTTIWEKEATVLGVNVKVRLVGEPVGLTAAFVGATETTMPEIRANPPTTVVSSIAVPANVAAAIVVDAA